MSKRIHTTALIDPSARLADDVSVGPFCVIGKDVVVGSGTRIGPQCVIEGPTTIGEDNLIYGQSAIGTDPQDLKFRGERTTVEIGDRNKIREFVTINRGTEGGIAKTAVGSGNLLMTGVHVAHDCEIGDEAILANSATLAGHVEVGSFAIIGAFSGIHQFCRVGCYAFIGGYSVITRDALPFIKTVGTRNDAGLFGINSLGLRRRKFSSERIDALKEAYRVLLRQGRSMSDAVRLLRERGATPDVEILLDFIESSRRGFVRATPSQSEVPASTSAP